MDNKHLIEKRPVVSIVVPMHNSGTHIRKCIDSIITQDYKELDIVLVDDGSTDNTRMVCDEYVGDARIRIFDGKGEGVSNARNIGIENAVGEYIAFIDSDDWIEADYISTLINGICGDDDIYMISYYEEFKNSSRHINFFNTDYFEICNEDRFDLLTTCLINRPLGNQDTLFPIGVPWGKIYRKAFLDKNKIRFCYGLKRMQDTVFNLYAFSSALKIKYEDIPRYHYRRDSGSTTFRYDPDFESTSLQILSEVRHFFEVRNIEGYEEAYYAKAFMNFLECVRTQYLSDECKLSMISKIRNVKRIAKTEPYKYIARYVKQDTFIDKKKYALKLLCKERYILLYYAILFMRIRRMMRMY